MAIIGVQASSSRGKFERVDIVNDLDSCFEFKGFLMFTRYRIMLMSLFASPNIILTILYARTKGLVIV